MILEIDNVELYFKKKRVLNGIYLKAETGQVTGILGRNGSGKSSVLEIAFGNLKPKYKLIRIDGKPILKPFYKTRLVRYLPQYHFVPKYLKLKKLFELFKINWNTFTDHFEEFSVLENLKFNKLSGGQRRFIETYLILKGSTKIVFLDEPFNGISPIRIENVKSIIKQEKETKVIILTDHRYDDVIEVTENLYLLHNGQTKRVNKLTDLEDYGYLRPNALS